MVRVLRFLLVFVGLVLFSAVLSAVTTVLLSPFWSWFEHSYGIEAVGHSGPAAWCYLVTFFVFLCIETLIMTLRRRR